MKSTYRDICNFSFFLLLWCIPSHNIDLVFRLWCSYGTCLVLGKAYKWKIVELASCKYWSFPFVLIYLQMQLVEIYISQTCLRSRSDKAQFYSRQLRFCRKFILNSYFQVAEKNNDVQLQEFVEGGFLNEQVKPIRKSKPDECHTDATVCRLIINKYFALCRLKL